MEHSSYHFLVSLQSMQHPESSLGTRYLVALANLSSLSIYHGDCSPGAIEVSTTSTRGAKRIAELAKDDSDHEGEASSAFEIAQKKLRVVGVSSEENPEIALKMPGKSEDDTDELNAILFGGPRQEKGFDDEQDKKRRATVRNKKAVSLPSKPASQPDGGNAPSAEVAGTASSSTGWNLNSMSAPVSHKKAASESKELDKAEALVLSVNQLKFQVQEESSIMLITLKTVRALTDKVSNRLTPDATQFFMDAVKRSGSSSRAAAVWQSLKDSKACLETCLLINFLKISVLSFVMRDMGMG